MNKISKKLTNRNGWSSIEYIIGSVIIATVMATILNLFGESITKIAVIKANELLNISVK